MSCIYIFDYSNMSSMNITDIEPRVEEVAQLLLAMANPKRLLILCNLLDQERSVGELSKIVELAQSPLSQHLAKLRALGLVKAHREGQLVKYRLSSPQVIEVLNTLYRIYCAPEMVVTPRGE